MASVTSICSGCGSDLRPGASFCRACGTPAAQAGSPAVAATCPQCRHVNPLDSKFCRACGTPLAAQRALQPEVSDGGESPPPAPPRSSSRRRAAVVASTIAVLLLAGGGAALAVVLTGHSRPAAGAARSGSHASASAKVVSSSVSNPPSTTTAGGTTVTGTTAAATTLLPDQSQAQMTQAIQQMLLQFHQDISTGNWRDAWSLLSARKQQQSLQEVGYNGWIKNQKSLGQYLDPSGLQVSIVSTDTGSGVATVNVTGMSWSPPGRSSCGWNGITWVKYENGNWRYDPGYSTTAQRRAQWGPPENTSSPAYSTWVHKTWPKLMGGLCVPPD